MNPRFSKEMLPSNLTYPDDDKLTQNLQSAFAISDWIIRIGSSIRTFTGIYQKLKGFTHLTDLKQKISNKCVVLNLYRPAVLWTAVLWRMLRRRGSRLDLR